MDTNKKDILILYYDDDDTVNSRELTEILKSAFRNLCSGIIVLPKGYDIEFLEEEKMNKLGWYRK